jgi:hypothetical protein
MIDDQLRQNKASRRSEQVRVVSQFCEMANKSTLNSISHCRVEGIGLSMSLIYAITRTISFLFVACLLTCLGNNVSQRDHAFSVNQGAKTSTSASFNIQPPSAL